MSGSITEPKAEATSFATTLAGLIRLMRPHHWTKNAFCFAGIIFGGFYHNPECWLKATLVFIYFCLASSTIYIWNDIFDRDLDKLHPKKKRRPLPAGHVPVSVAKALGLILLVIVLAGDWVIGMAAQICLLMYLAINVAYTVRLKHMPLLDICCIAAGFILRLLAGIYTLGDTPTTWITLCTMGLALLLATAKRRSELSRVGEDGKSQRPVLAGYSLPLLDSLMNSAATSTVIFYALFTVLSDKNPTLVATVPVVYFGIMRYKTIVMVRSQGEEPEMILLKDRGIQASLIIWFTLYASILFFQPHLFR